MRRYAVQVAQQQGVYAITGGSGGLGLLFGSWLQQAGCLALLLLGRTGRTAAPAELRSLAGSRCQVTAMRADVVRGEEAQAAVASAQGLAGFIHAAGIQVLCV